MVKKLSFSTVEKVRDFVDNRGRLPDNISRENICKDIVQLLESNVATLQKNQVNGVLKVSPHPHNYTMLYFEYFVDLDSPK